MAPYRSMTSLPQRVSDRVASFWPAIRAGAATPPHRIPTDRAASSFVNVSDVGTTRAAFIDALRSAYAVRRGVTPQLETATRIYARAMRLAGEDIGRTLVQVKDLVRAHSGYDEPIVMPKVVGWTVAGFFEGTPRRDAPRRED